MDGMELMARALRARERAYAPYSNFLVGAALLAQDGRVFEGCNVENAAYSVCNCAERTALFSAVAQGCRRFSAIAVAGAPRGAADAHLLSCPPCGVCRQALLEFCDPDGFAIYLADGCGGVRRTSLRQLLPEAFSLERPRT